MHLKCSQNTFQTYISIQGHKGTKIDKMDGERQLLNFVCTKIYKIDPDVIIGHDICGFDLEVLLHRSIVNKIPHWSRFGRLKRSQPIKTGRGLFLTMKIDRKKG